MNMFQEEYNLMNNGYIETSKTESIELNCNALHSTNYKVAREYELSPEQYDLLVLACAEVAGSEDNEVNELNFMSAITRNQAKKEQVHDAIQNELPFAADFSDEEKEGKERAASEAADLLYHAMVLMNIEGVTLEDVNRELRRREGTSGILEKASRTAK